MNPKNAWRVWLKPIIRLQTNELPGKVVEVDVVEVVVVEVVVVELVVVVESGKVVEVDVVELVVVVESSSHSIW